MNHPLNQQIAALEAPFVEGGGYSEQLAAKRLEHRSNQADLPDRPDFPPCPDCGKPVVMRLAKTGANAGREFLESSGYPGSKGACEL